VAGSACGSAFHAVTWPYTAAVLAATALYRLLAEWQRRKTLIDLVSRAPANTIVILEKGPGGPAMWVKVGDGGQPPLRAEVRHGQGARQDS
jgi:hypothetical protein